jgi:hypothetical protein
MPRKAEDDLSFTSLPLGNATEHQERTKISTIMTVCKNILPECYIMPKARELPARTTHTQSYSASLSHGQAYEGLRVHLPWTGRVDGALRRDYGERLQAS